MGTETQVDMDWAGTELAESGAGEAAAGAAGARDAAGGAARPAYLTDEEILGISPVGGGDARKDSSGEGRPRNDRQLGTDGEDGARGEVAELGHKGAQAEAYATGATMPSWMVAAAADPRNAEEARALWAEHQEARAIKELLPGGVRDAVSLREATQSVERIDAALFSGDARAQADVVAEMARVNPAAFRSMFAEAARVMAGLDGRGARQDAGGRDAGRGDGQSFSGDGHSSANGRFAGPTLREGREGWGTQKEQNQTQQNTQTQNNLVIPNEVRNLSSIGRDDTAEARRDSSGNNGPRNDNAHGNAANTDRPSQELTASASPTFDAAAYSAFERATNDAVARDVRGSIFETLARVMPEGVAEGAARRIGEDIFGEVHRALAADRALSEQVASVLRPPSQNGGYGAAGDARSANGSYGAARFGLAEQQRVAALVAGRAKQLVPSVARRVIGEWTSSVLNTARSKAARQAAAASRVDIAAPGGSSDSMPLRAMTAREVNYASMSDEQILGM